MLQPTVPVNRPWCSYLGPARSRERYMSEQNRAIASRIDEVNLIFRVSRSIMFSVYDDWHLLFYCSGSRPSSMLHGLHCPKCSLSSRGTKQLATTVCELGTIWEVGLRIIHIWEQRIQSQVLKLVVRFGNLYIWSEGSYSTPLGFLVQIHMLNPKSRSLVLTIFVGGYPALYPTYCNRKICHLQPLIYSFLEELDVFTAHVLVHVPMHSTNYS